MLYELVNEWMRFYRGAAVVASKDVAHQSKATVSSGGEAMGSVRGECPSPSKSLVPGCSPTVIVEQSDLIFF